MRVRLLLGLVWVGAPLLAAWAITAVLLSNTLTTFDRLADEAAGEARTVTVLSGAITTAQRDLDVALRPGSGAAARDHARRDLAAVDRAVTRIETDTAREQDLVSQAAGLWRRARGDAQHALRAGGRTPAERAFLRRSEGVEAISDELRAVADRELGLEVAAARERRRFVVIAMLALAAAAAVFAFAVARRLARTILAPLDELRRAADAMTIDDLSSRALLDESDEFGALGRAFDAMADRLEQSRDKLRHQAFHDVLTELPNRALLVDRVEHARIRVSRQGRPVGVLVLDIDGFKEVNDTLGHSAGDGLLVQVAARLRGALRRHDTAARMGGDEFAVLLEDLAEPAEATRLADRILAALRAPFDVAGQEVLVTASLGIALGFRETPEELIRNADIAMYRAKADGKDRAELFQPEMYADALERRTLERELRRAIGTKCFRLQYQPLVSMNEDGARVYGFEALARWHHPERGVVPPAIFVPIAEETGLIGALGHWVLETACRTAAAWPCIDDAPLTISVNVSPRQLTDPHLAASVGRVLAETGLEPERLMLEITESALAREQTFQQLLALKELGVGLAVDDFGTGYSSLDRLRRLPVDVVKIDKSFVDGVAAGDAAFVSAILQLAGDVGLTTVAEGVEEIGQRDSLLRLGCSRAQGYLFARPLDDDAVVDHVRAFAASQAAVAA